MIKKLLLGCRENYTIWDNADAERLSKYCEGFASRRYCDSRPTVFTHLRRHFIVTAFLKMHSRKT